MQLVNYELLVYPADESENPKRLSAAVTNFNAAQLPSCVIRVAVGDSILGRGRRNDNRIPADWLDELKLLRVAVRMKKHSVRTGRPKTTEHVLFEGYPNAPAVALNERNGEIQIELQHWLRDLASSSLVHQYAAPMEIYNEDIETLFYPKDNEAAGVAVVGATNEFWSYGLPDNYPELIQQDTWALGLKEMLAFFATEKTQGQYKNLPGCSNLINLVSPAAQDALEKIQGPSTKLGRPYSEGGLPLKVRSRDGVVADEVYQGLAHMIGESDLSAFAGQSFWSRMLLTFQNLFVELIARPTDALVVPVTVAQSEFYETELLEDSVADIRWAESRQMGIRGVVMYGTQVYNEGYVSTEGDRKNKVPAGCYIASEDPRLGRIYPLDAPIWLSKEINFADTVGAVAKRRDEEPDTADDPNRPDPEPYEPSQLNEIFNDYAHTRYLEEALRYRRMQVVTNFRVDISLGSTIAVSARTDAIAATVGSETTTLVGRVVGLTHQMDRTAKKAVTIFTLRYVRTLQELESEEFVLDQHPIFDGQFLGTNHA